MEQFQSKTWEKLFSECIEKKIEEYLGRRMDEVIDEIKSEIPNDGHIEEVVNDMNLEIPTYKEIVTIAQEMCDSWDISESVDYYFSRDQVRKEMAESVLALIKEEMEEILSTNCAKAIILQLRECFLCEEVPQIIQRKDFQKAFALAAVSGIRIILVEYCRDLLQRFCAMAKTIRIKFNLKNLWRK